MISIKKYAAIDIGSNAMRLLVANVIEEKGMPTHFTKNALVRLPIRLGQDSFTVGDISDENIDRMVDAMNAFKLLMKVHNVEKYKALATSAMREATNSADVIKIIQEGSKKFFESIGDKAIYDDFALTVSLVSE
jgi:exopolyphosphatase/guanosine-5'-triphosphate,3'-diphosphate pyrophosphatase